MKFLSMIPSGKLRRSLDPEAGQTLVLALIVMAALTITTAGVITFMTSNETSSGRDRQVVSALSSAEAGLSNGISWVIKNDSSNDTITYPSDNQPHTFGPVSLDGKVIVSLLE